MIQRLLRLIPLLVLCLLCGRSVAATNSLSLRSEGAAKTADIDALVQTGDPSNDGASKLIGTISYTGGVKADSIASFTDTALAAESILYFKVTGTPATVTNATIALKVQKS